MKILINAINHMEDGAPITAMVTINPGMCKQYDIEVEVEQRDEGEIPHIHVYPNTKRNPRECSYIRLDKPEYSNHHKHNKKMSKKLKKQFISIMESNWDKHYRECGNGEIRVATGYEGAVDTWVECYENGEYTKFTLDQNGDPVMPDYTKL